jgi:hypothetical protein
MRSLSSHKDTPRPRPPTAYEIRAAQALVCLTSWSVSAFVRQLPTMSSAEYQAVADRYAAMQKNGEQPD